MSRVRQFLDSKLAGWKGLTVDFRNDLDMSNPTQQLAGSKFGFKEVIQSKRKFQNKLHNSNPIAPGLADIVNWVLYDRNSFAASTTTPSLFKFFNQPIGQSSKTKADTNLDQVSRLPDPMWFNTLGLGFYWAPNVLTTDIIAFTNTSYFEFWIGSKWYIEGPIQVFPSAAGIVSRNVAATATVTMSTNGSAMVDNMFDLRLPAGINLGYQTDPSTGGQSAVTSDGLTGVTILQGQNFTVNVNSPGGGTALTASGSAGTGLNLMCFLFGILSRGVQ